MRISSLLKILYVQKFYIITFVAFSLIIFVGLITLNLITLKIKPLIIEDENPTPAYWHEEYWEKTITKYGPSKAYARLKETFLNSEYLPTHQALHAFGFALYEKFGPDGIQYCDDYQRYGCFHGFLASYLSDKGITSLNDAQFICPSNKYSKENKCMHGIGHGLVDNLGKSNLNKALQYCKKIDSLTYLGCPQGAIMEYYAPINRSANLNYEQFDINQPFKPCSLLDSEFQKYCYFFVPGFYWPKTVLEDSLKAESYCQSIENYESLKMCVVGIGVNLSNKSNFDLIKSQESCLKMKEMQNQIYCVAGVKWNAGSDKSNIKIADSLCDRFGEEANNECQRIQKELNN